MRPLPRKFIVAFVALAAVATMTIMALARATTRGSGPSTRPARTTRPAGRRDRIAYRRGRRVATLANRQIAESSGLACSRLKPDVFWTHNDSGDKPRLYAFDTKGRDLGTYGVPEARAIDWEDMASFALDGKNYLLLADVGNNHFKRESCTLYIVEEPRLRPGDRKVRGRANLVRTIHYTYKDGPDDCEAVAVDPTSRTILLVTKRRRRTVYTFAMPEKPTEKAMVAEPIATLSLGWTTAMDVSPDGRRAIVLTYGDAFEYARGPGETWSQAFARRPRQIIVPARPQGESICYGSDGRTLYLTSEKLPTPLLKIPVIETP